jgi:uncharacterized membrane protein
MQWYYAKDGTQFGPVDDTEFRRLARSGEIAAEDLVWNSTMGEEWKPASSFGFLFFPPVDLQPPSIPSEAESSDASQSDGTTPNRYLTARARASLKGHWGMAVMVMIVFLALTLLIAGPEISLTLPAKLHAQQEQREAIVAAQQHHQSITHLVPPKIVLPLGTRIVSYGLQFLQYLLAGPFAVGLCFFFLNIANRSEAKITDVFKGFTFFWKAVGTYFLMGLLILAWALLFALPAIAFLIWNKIDIFHGEYPHSPIFVLLCIAGIITLSVKILSYAMTFFVIADEPTVGPLQAIKKSTIMMAGRKWKYICLQLRFIGWWLLSLLTCYIGLLWLIPYITTAKAHFYLDVKGRASLAESSAL